MNIVILLLTIFLWIVFGQLNILPNHCYDKHQKKYQMNWGNKSVWWATLIAAIMGTIYVIFTNMRMFNILP